ncbi:MAG: DegT/DnrJ/EryC1/StrS family aminotransferase [Candidatus Staskawiczbacteria bacterium]|nr:DegT/DnrJ/EryC1/StrS family aminotransferase [Candidatus Staskawiczbacteria bacterium]
MKYKFGDLVINDKAKKLVKKSLDENWVSGGNLVKELEREWGKLFGYKYNVAMSNGTDADIAALLTLYDFGAKRGDEIIIPALAFVSVGNSVLASGFKPVFVDIESKTLNINPKKIEEKITSKTRAIMVVHTMGKPCDMKAIQKIAKKHNLKIIEDCCEAHGARYRNKFVGHFGSVATFSFYVAHVISGGDGGMCSTNSPKIYEVLLSLKDHGRKPGSLYFDHIRHGLNFRMNILPAAIILSELKNFWKIFNKRKNNLNYLLKKTKKLEEFASFNAEEQYETTSPHAFSITLNNPKYNYKKLYEFLENNSIECKRNFGSMPTQHKAFKFLGHKTGEFPEAEYVGDNGLHFGVHQHLSRKDLDYASDVLHKYFHKYL